MAKTSVDLDQGKVAQARDIPGTTTLRSTLEEALDRIIREHARKQLLAMADDGMFDDLLDPDFVREMWR